MVDKDLERFDRLFQRFSGTGIDYIFGYGETDKGQETYIRYLSGTLIDYSLIVVDVKREELFGIVNVMEGERAHKYSWLDKIYIYGGSLEGDYINLKSRNLVDSIKEVIDAESKIGIAFNSVSASFIKTLESIFSKDNIVDISSELMDLRLRKTRYEVERIKKAAEIVDYGIYESSKKVVEGITEKELALHGMCEMYRAGADKVYDYLIVASGYASANPHWRASENTIKVGDPIVFDYVAAYNGYYSDETRTVFFKTIYKGELRKIYETVLDAQVSAIDIIEPGVKASDVDKKARSIIESAGYGKYFIHSTGHGVGLEIHEKPRLSKNDDTVLDEGFVITVEPGIYIPGLGGVRIEDMVLVTSDGHRVLTRLNKALTIL